jgi:hypothetical protein
MMRQTQVTANPIDRQVAAMASDRQVAAMASDGDVPLPDDGDSVSLLPSNTPLTRKNLACLNALNGCDQDDDIDSAYLFDDDSDDTMKKFSTTHSSFEQRACENGILDPTVSPPPPDHSTIQNHLTQRRTSTQPSETTNRQYSKAITKSYNVQGVTFCVHSHMMKDYGLSDVRYGRAYSRAVTETPSQDFNDSLSNPLPDILEGLYTEALPNYLQNNTLHATSTGSLSFCHFATEFKRTNGNLHQATVQAAYDGAVLVNARDRALSQARASGKDATAIDKAAKETAVFTCVTDGTVAEVFAHHSQDRQYYQNLVARESLLDYPNRGRELIRNTQDYARSKSYELANLLGADLKEELEELEEPEEVVVNAKKEW